MKTVTVVLPRDEYNELCNLLQLIVVLQVRLYIQGIQPDISLLGKTFDRLARAGLAESSFPEPDHNSHD